MTVRAPESTKERELDDIKMDLEVIAFRLHEFNRAWQSDRIADFANEIERFCAGGQLRCSPDTTPD